MTETTREVQHFGQTWLGKVFHKKEKKKKLTEILTECNNRLTCMIEEQSRLISSLTFENGRNDRLIKEYEQKIQTLTNDIDKLQDTIKRSSELQEGQRDKIQTQYYDIQSLSSEKTDLIEAKSGLEREKEQCRGQIRALEQEVFHITERMRLVKSENESLHETNSTLKNDTEVTSQALFEETVKLKLLQKDYQIAQRDVDIEIKKREEIEKRMSETQNRLISVISARNRTENELGAVNECLKYEVVILRKKVERKRQREKRLETDKQLILRYYRNKEEEQANLLGGVTGSFNTNILADVSYAGILQTKVLNLESKLYRRNQLVEELEEMVRDYDPGFTIRGSGVLKHYLDDDGAVEQCTDDIEIHDLSVTTTSYLEPSLHDLSVTTTSYLEPSLEDASDVSMSRESTYTESDCNSLFSEISTDSDNPFMVENVNQSATSVKSTTAIVNQSDLMSNTDNQTKSLVLYSMGDNLQF